MTRVARPFCWLQCKLSFCPGHVPGGALFCSPTTGVIHLLPCHSYVNIWKLESTLPTVKRTGLMLCVWAWAGKGDAARRVPQDPRSFHVIHVTAEMAPMAKVLPLLAWPCTQQHASRHMQPAGPSVIWMSKRTVGPFLLLTNAQCRAEMACKYRMFMQKSSFQPG